MSEASPVQVPAANSGTAPAPVGHRRRTGIVTQTVLLTAVVATVAVVVAGLIAYPLTRSAAEAQARTELVRLADLTSTALDRGLTEPGEQHGPGNGPLPHRLLESLDAAQVSGYLVTSAQAAPPGVATESVAQVLAGSNVSTSGTTTAGPVLIEGRPLVDGSGVFLEQPVTVAGVEASDALKRIALALLLGLVIAVTVGYLAARRLSRPLREARAAANAMAAGSRDVELKPVGPTEIADIAESLTHLNGALVVSEGRQRDFLMSVSHELRTPLTAVKGYAEAFADGVVPPDEAERTGATIAAEAARLDRLVSDLLDLARLGAVDFRMSPIDTDVVDIVHDAGEVWRARCAGEDVDFSLECPAHAVLVRTDPLRLRQVIDNLAENALRVSPPGSRIVLAVRDHGGWVDVEVRDSGPGLSDDDIAVAFEPGVLHDRYRGVRPVGTGLGLALVGRLATGLGGSAEAGRAPEGGARFTVRLPRT